jgi:acyl-CoA dehydrogenase
MAAWKIDQRNDYKAVRADISAVKAMMQRVLHDVSARALQLHGSLGTTHEMPFVQYLVESFVLGLADGPTEVHKVTRRRPSSPTSLRGFPVRKPTEEGGVKVVRTV